MELTKNLYSKYGKVFFVVGSLLVSGCFDTTTSTSSKKSETTKTEPKPFQVVTSQDASNLEWRIIDSDVVSDLKVDSKHYTGKYALVLPEHVATFDKKKPVGIYLICKKGKDAKSVLRVYGLPKVGENSNLTWKTDTGIMGKYLLLLGNTAIDDSGVNAFSILVFKDFGLDLMSALANSNSISFWLGDQKHKYSLLGFKETLQEYGNSCK